MFATYNAGFHIAVAIVVTRYMSQNEALKTKQVIVYDILWYFLGTYCVCCALTKYIELIKRQWNCTSLLFHEGKLLFISRFHVCVGSTFKKL